MPGMRMFPVQQVRPGDQEQDVLRLQQTCGKVHLPADEEVGKADKRLVIIAAPKGEQGGERAAPTAFRRSWQKAVGGSIVIGFG